MIIFQHERRWLLCILSRRTSNSAIFWTSICHPDCCGCFVLALVLKIISQCVGLIDVCLYFLSGPSECGWKGTVVSTGLASTTLFPVSRTALCLQDSPLWSQQREKLWSAHRECLLPSPLAPCSSMSYHHDSRRIFIGQDNGAVVVSPNCAWRCKNLS